MDDAVVGEDDLLGIFLCGRVGRVVFFFFLLLVGLVERSAFGRFVRAFSFGGSFCFGRFGCVSFLL